MSGEGGGVGWGEEELGGVGMVWAGEGRVMVGMSREGGGDRWGGDGQGWERRGVGMVWGEVMSHPHLTLTQEWGWVGIKGKKMVGGRVGRGWVWIGGERDGTGEENRNERGGGNVSPSPTPSPRSGDGLGGERRVGMGCGNGWGGEGVCEEGGYGEEMGGVQWRGEDMGDNGVGEVRR
ncbi:hypothetical protein V8E53_004018 [Lactarius tabidus]